jgi:hypothetical protein
MTEQDVDLVVVPHRPGGFELEARDHELTVVSSGQELEPLPPFEIPDVAALKEKWATRPDEPARFRVEGGRLDLSDFEDAIETARQHGSPIEFHLF